MARVYDLLDTLFRYSRLFKVRRLFEQKSPKYVKVYTKESWKLPKAWQTTPFVSRLIVEIKIKKLLYMREGFLIKL